MVCRNDVFMIDCDHDARVIGEDPCILLDFNEGELSHPYEFAK